MGILGVFLFNILCGLVPCDPNFGAPVISSKPYPEIGDRDGKLRVDVEPKVTVQQGKIEGYHMKTILGRTIFAFEGIPYGIAERWKSPVPREEWKGTWNAKKKGSDCLQLSASKYVRVYGSEICHFLNVFTPDLPRKGGNPKYPVIVYFHSGGFLMGSGSEHGPTYMLDEDVVLVTMNYRLGVLGFISTGDASLPGNYGLKDQALGIQWVKDNIAKFGGDENNINLMGYSAGGICVHLHLMSNQTKHLFQKGMSIGSGSALQHWAVQGKKRSQYYANRIAGRVGCGQGGQDGQLQVGTESWSAELVKCLRKVPVNTLVAEQLNLFDWFPFPPVFFAPVVEPPHPEAFLTETPSEAYANGNVERKPWIHGMTSHEGLTPVLLIELFFRWIPFRLFWNHVSKSYLDLQYLNTIYQENLDLDRITRKVTDLYVGKGRAPMTGSQFEFAEMSTHRFFHYGVLKALQAHAKIAPTYGYFFTFRHGRYNMGNLYGHKSWEWGPGHAEDEFYYFNTSSQHPGFSETDPDYKMAQVMLNFLGNFVRDGEPSYTKEDGESLKIWKQIEPAYNCSSVISDNLRLLKFDKHVDMISYPDVKEIKFWESLNLPDMKACVDTSKL